MAPRARVTLVLGLSALMVLAVVVPSSARPAHVPGQPVHLALGDSWGAGFGAPAGEGYVDVLHGLLRDGYDCSPAASSRAAARCGGLQLDNVSVPGATTPTMVAGQLPYALAVLADRNGDANPRNDVEVVPVSIGGNDVVNPILAACLGGLSPTCLSTVQTEFATYAADLHGALGALRVAAGPDTPIVLGTYDNGIAYCALGLSDPAVPVLGALVLEGGELPGVGELPGLHDVMRQVAAAHDVTVASSFGMLGADDWVGGADCLHPDASGYAKVAAAFASALGV